MNLNSYQALTLSTAYYDDAGTGSLEELSFLALGLNGEAGEVAEIIKMALRRDADPAIDYRERLRDELGDVLYYLARLAAAVDVSLEAVARANIRKARSRAALHKLVREELEGGGTCTSS